MIAKKHRFHGHNSLNYVYKKGSTVRSECISLRTVTNKRVDYRMAVVVSKKVSKSAVVRNRIRRRVYEIVRTHKDTTQIAWKYDIVFLIYDERVATMGSNDLRIVIKKLLQRASID